MRAILLSLIASTALAQGYSGAPSASSLFTAKQISVRQGDKICFNSPTNTHCFSSDGTTLTLTTLNLSAPVVVATGDISALAASNSAKLGLHTSLPGIWFANAAPSLSNYAFLFDGTNVAVNAPSGGYVALRANNSTFMSASSALSGICVSTGDVGICNGTVQHGLDVATAQTLTVDDDGAGTAATATLTPTSRFVNCTCNDADGCAITMGESGMVSGSLVQIVSSTANACTFADTAGVSELTGAITLGQWDSLVLVYVTDRWVQLSTSNN